MKALVTGGTGFLGSHLCLRLMDEGYEVSLLRRPASRSTGFEDLPIQERIGDVVDAEAVDDAINGHDLVVDGGVVGGRLWTPHQEGVKAMRQAFGVDEV